MKTVVVQIQHLGHGRMAPVIDEVSVFVFKNESSH